MSFRSFAFCLWFHLFILMVDVRGDLVHVVAQDAQLEVAHELTKSVSGNCLAVGLLRNGELAIVGYQWHGVEDHFEHSIAFHLKRDWALENSFFLEPSFRFSLDEIRYPDFVATAER